MSKIITDGSYQPDNRFNFTTIALGASARLVRGKDSDAANFAMRTARSDPVAEGLSGHKSHVGFEIEWDTDLSSIDEWNHTGHG